MGFRCSICRSDKREEIDRAMLAGDSDAAIAAAHPPIQSTSVAVHRAKHLILSPIRITGKEREEYRASLQEFHCASLRNRVGVIQGLIDDLYEVKAARAEAYADCVGGSTGLVVPRKRTLYSVKLADGTTEATVVIDEELDLAWVEKMKALQQTMASLIGEWDPSGLGADGGSGGSQVTIFQSVRGEIQQAIGQADARPGAKQRTLPAVAEVEIPDAD